MAEQKAVFPANLRENSELDAGFRKYRVVQAEKVEWKPPIAAVNALADQGYRLLVPGPLFILRLESTAPDTYRYMAMKDIR